jgi:hypothetical protein
MDDSQYHVYPNELRVRTMWVQDRLLDVRLRSEILCMMMKNNKNINRKYDAKIASPTNCSGLSPNVIMFERGCDHMIY